MQKSIPIGIALILAACGAAVTTTNEAESAPQKGARRNAPQRDVGFPNFDDNAGMAGCFDPNLTGYQRRAAEAAGGRPCAQSRASQRGSDAAAQGGGSWEGDYDGQLAGGPGHLGISAPTSAGYHRIQFDVGNGACAGSASQRPTGNRMVLEIPVNNNQSICSITLTRNGSSIAMREEGCLRAARRVCGFSGTVSRGGGLTMPTRSFTIVPTASSIAGAWASDMRQCDTVAMITLRTDGSFSTPDEAGSWQASGSTLTLVSRETYSEDGDAIPLRTPRPRRYQFGAIGRNGLQLRASDGTVFNLMRCQ